MPSGRRPPSRSRGVTLAGLILEVRRRGTRVSFMLDDRSGRMEVTMFEETYQRYRELVVKDALVQVEGACASMSSAMPGDWSPSRSPPWTPCANAWRAAW